MIGSKGDAMVRPGWSEGGARVKQRSSKGSKGSMKGEKVAQTSYQTRLNA